MTTSWRIGLCALVCCCAGLIGLGPIPHGQAVEPARPVASITAVLHSGLLLRLGLLHPTAATPFTPLFSGDRLRTGRGQRTAILLQDGSQFLLSENTDLGVAFPVLRLYHGEIFGRVPHSGVRHAVVRTDAAVAAVQGTEFDVVAGTPGHPATTVLTVVSGTVSLSNPRGSVLVGTSQQSQATPNTAPSSPVVVAVAGIVRWIARVQLVTTIALPPHYSTPAAAAAAALAARARLARSSGDVGAHLALADALLDAGSASMAGDEYRRSLVGAPDRAQRVRAEAGLATAHFALGDLARASAAAEAALVLDSCALDAGLMQGNVALARGDLPRAQATYQRMLACFPRSPRPLASLGLVLFLQRQDGAAGRALRAALRLRPPGWLAAIALVDLSALASAQGDLTSALSYARQATTADPRANAGWVTLGVTQSQLGHYGEALQALEHAARLGTSFEQMIALDDLGDTAYKLGRLDISLAAYQAAAARNPADAAAANGEGTLELALGHAGAAVAATRRSVELAPDVPALRADYARALWYGRQNRLAETVCRTGLRTFPSDANLWLVLGYALDGQGRTGEAHAAYERAYAQRPQTLLTAEDAAFAGRLALYAGRMVAARADLRRAVDIHPTDYSYWRDLALVEQRMRDFPAAARAAGRAVAINPQDIVAHLTLSQVYSASGDDTRAVREDMEILRLDPQEITVHADLGLIARRHGALTAARDQFLAEIRAQSTPAHSGDPGSSAALAPDWAELGLTYEMLGQPRSAATAYLQALRYAPRKGAYYRALGRQQRQIGQLEQAIVSFTAAIRLDPHDQAAFYFRASAEQRTGHLSAAEDDLRRALTLDPRDVAARELLGIVLASLGRYEEAATQYGTAAALLASQSGAGAMWAAQGNALDRIGRYGAAIPAYRRALAADPRNTLAHSALGLDLARGGHLAAARVQFQIVLAQDPRDRFALFDLALIDEQQGHTEQAIAELRQQIAVNRQGPPALLATDYRGLGQIYATHGRWHEASRSFGHVITLGSPNDADYFNLGYVQARAGDARGARANLSRARALALAAGHAALAKAACTEVVKSGGSCGDAR